MKTINFYLLFILLVSTTLIQVKAQNIEEAIRLSHAGKYNEAETVFTKLLDNDEKNVNILIASGFNNAWNKKFFAAKNRFQSALKIESFNQDATKGLAYSYLYQGCFPKAARIFSDLSKIHPSSEEYHIALGLAYMNMQKKNKANTEFEKAIKINNGNKEVKKYLSQIKSEKGIIEISALAGLSSYDNENKVGLRQVQAGYHINSEVFLYARYDNSLSLDNYFFLKNNYNTNAMTGGIYTRWHYLIGSRFEYGYRNFPGKISQNIFQTEQAVFLPKNLILKLGGSLLTSNQLQNEWMLMGSISIPVFKKLRLEPQYYLVHRIADEHRVLLNISYHFSDKTDIALGVFNGSENNSKTNIHYKVFGVYTYSNFHITGPLSGILLARFENDAAGRNSIVAAAGLKVKLNPKR